MWDHQRVIPAALAALVVASGAVVGAAAAEPPLPSFTVQAATDLRPVVSAELSTEPRWLIVYVTPSCDPCQRLLRALRDWQSPALLTRTVVIVGAAAPEGQRLAAGSAGGIPGVPWFVDADRQASRALRLDNAPALVAVERGTLKWIISGVLNDPSVLESTVRAWVEPTP
jgi:hypothetical protein